MALEVWITKVLVLVALFVVTLGFSLIPVKFKSVIKKTTDSNKQHRYQTAISFCSCFAGGVFLATCFLDLFPHVQEQVNEAFDQYQVVTSFPFAEFVMIFGLFLILLIEQLVLYVKEHQGSVEAEKEPLLPSASRASSRKSSIASLSYQSDRALSVGISDRPVIHHEKTSRPVSPDLDQDLTPAESNLDVVISEEHQRGHHGHGHHDHRHSHLHDDFSVHADLSSHSVIRSVLLLLALSFHSVFEGLALGLQKTTEGVVNIFTALVIHKSILAFSLGINLVQSRLSFWATIRSNVLFAVASPIGIGIGILVLDAANSKSTNLASGILQGIACGTFLYVTFFEILPHEFNNGEHRLLKVLFLVLGFGVMVGVMFIHSEAGDHEHHHAIDTKTTVGF